MKPKFIETNIFDLIYFNQYSSKIIFYFPISQFLVKKL